MRAGAVTIPAVGVAGTLALGAVIGGAPRTPHPLDAAVYIGSERCGGCHPAEYAKWQGSHHALAMQRADARTVLGDFDGATFAHRGQTWRFSRRGGAYVVSAEGPDGALHDYEVSYTFGVDPLQQYLIGFPGGRLQALSVAWDTRAKRWFFLYPGQDIPPTDWLHWTRQGQSWNTMCADCHSTRVEKRFDAATGTFDTRFAEIAVGCEACHGPGSQHAARPAIAVRAARPRAPDLVEQCAACHSRRAAFADRGDPGEPLLDRYRPALLSAGVFHADGQILDEDFEVQSFWQSKMYGKGVTCADCHDPHSGKRRADGNALCTRCHGADRFDTPAHFRHAREVGGRPSAAAQCTSCHMPERSYMVVHARRDHSLRVPRPDLSEATGSPNACAAEGCHADQPAAWLAAAFRAKYGAQDRRPSPGPLLAAGRRRDPGAAGPLATLAADAGQPAIVRASAIELLGGYGTAEPGGALEALLRDRDGLVRYAAASHLSLADPARLAPLCADPLRAVRMAAAVRLAAVPRPRLQLDDAAARACDRSLDEHVAGQEFTADMPSGPFGLGNLYASLGRAADAEREYRRALAIDDQLVQAQVNLALLVARGGRLDEAEALLRSALAAQPDLAVAAFDLGLVLAERGRLAEARELFRRAASLRPDDPRYARAAAER